MGPVRRELRELVGVFRKCSTGSSVRDTRRPKNKLRELAPVSVGSLLRNLIYQEHMRGRRFWVGCLGL